MNSKMKNKNAKVAEIQLQIEKLTSQESQLLYSALTDETIRFFLFDMLRSLNKHLIRTTNSTKYNRKADKDEMQPETPLAPFHYDLDVSTRRKGNTWEKILKEVLGNKHFLSTNRDVVRFANEFFHFELSFEKFMKRGRHDIINHCLNKFRELPHEKQKAMAEQLLETASLNKNNQSYEELFKLLIRHE